MIIGDYVTGTVSLRSNGFEQVVSFVNRSEVRVKVLEDILRGPKTTSELASIENKHVSHVSRAIAELQACGPVKPVSSGTGREERQKPYQATDLGFLMAATFMKLVR